MKIGCIHLKNSGGFISVLKGKGGKDRDVYIDRELSSHLKVFIAEKKELWDEPNGPSDYLFRGREGGRITCSALTASFTRAVKQAGLWNKGQKRNFSIHSARHLLG